MITLKQLKSKLEKDFGWENLELDENKWLLDSLLKDTIEAIEVIRCCETLKGKETVTFEEYTNYHYIKNKDGDYICRSTDRFNKKEDVKKEYINYVNSL
tara:strand:- start:8 stop:304 length:297 start_codon:yes stop_codon:yes gene_type:complete